jgi:hypothetical protein
VSSNETRSSEIYLNASNEVLLSNHILKHVLMLYSMNSRTGKINETAVGGESFEYLAKSRRENMLSRTSFQT